MMYGIMAEKDVELSSIVRALKEGITPKKVEDRLSRIRARLATIWGTGAAWRSPATAEARDAASLFEFFGLNTG